MGIMKDLARHGKDKALSRTLEVLLDQLLSKYGRTVGIRLDSNARRIEIEMLLKGETEPVSVLLENYEIVSEGERHFITCRGVHASREWMKILANDLIPDRRFEIPAKYALLLDIIV